MVAPPAIHQPIYCRRCFYVLNGVASPRCPECGTDFSPRDPTTYLRSPLSLAGRRWRAWVATLLLVLGAFNILAFLFIGQPTLRNALTSLDPVPPWAILWIWLPLNSLGSLAMGTWLWRSLRKTRR